MSVVLSEHLPLLATAPDGVQKLRGLILELAVRGKLVPQDLNDEPASELLKRIAEERARLEAEGTCKKSKARLVVEEDEWPFSLPETWAWARLTDIYFSISPSNNKLLSSEIREVGAVPVVDQGKRFIAGYTDDASLVIKIPGPVVIFGDHTTERKYVDFDFVAGADGVKILRPILQDEKFFFRQLQSFNLDERGYARHFKVLNEQLYALPPLAEQHRIAAKVGELMALCDRLEAEQADAEAAHAKLVDTLLGTLIQSTDAADLAANWQRLAEHFDTLFITESSIDAIKQTILQLAVMGKLVAQDPNDEPADELLKRIAQERARLEAEGVYKKSKLMPPVGEDERPFEVPEGWEWERIGNYVFQTDYGLSEKTFELNDGVPVLKMGDIQGGSVLLGGQKEVPPTTEGLPYLLLEPDDLLYNRTNSAELVGKTGIFRGQSQRFSFASYLIRIRCAKGMTSPAFLNMAMNAPMFRETEIVPHLKQQCGQANVNGTILRNMRIPVPPAAEQHRIVAKVNELMALCDRLKADLAESRRRQERLVSTLIESALKAA
ncbi:MAG TPA: restriction endonuclease subunit S [Noviherbaspirillum sp.]|nr:restriction endonuclease subunit S [Noviherbaspirillum sp.]